MEKETIKVETISSMEVAKMIEKDHKNLMRDIAKYTKYLEESNNDLGQLNFEPTLLEGKSNELKIEPVENCIINLNEFWIETSYKDVQGNERICCIRLKSPLIFGHSQFCYISSQYSQCLIL